MQPKQGKSLGLLRAITGSFPMLYEFAAHELRIGFRTVACPELSCASIRHSTFRSTPVVTSYRRESSITEGKTAGLRISARARRRGSGAFGADASLLGIREA